ncbi:MAG: hypothetical protein N3B10_02815 [Armatimonadetes bacterium]|nr:hypothetical protein [Armatimonadota bacterium]MCX7967403.1 hypothetical protein [Armatimonadota bacterium]MDW8142636.1 hypothetical protein [Armatimonadota bacterium]
MSVSFSAGIVYATLNALTGKDFEILNLLAIFAGSFIAFFVLTVLGYRQLRRVWKTLPDTAQRLGEPDQRIREKAFEDLMQRGNDAVPIFMRVLGMSSRESEFLNGRAAHLMAIGGLTKLKAKEAAPKLVLI